MTPTIRPGTPEDSAAIAVLHHAETGRTSSVENEQWLHELPSVVAEHEGELIGFAYCGEFAPDVAELLNMLVREDAHGTGVGSAMWRELESLLRAEATWNAVIAVNSSGYASTKPKRSAVQFYERLGFNVIARTPQTAVLYKSLTED